MPAEFRFHLKATKLGQQVNELKKQFGPEDTRGANAAIKKVNERSIDWLGRRAGENLKKRQKRDKDGRNTLRLAQIVAMSDASAATVNGFQFLIPKKIEKIQHRTEAYYRAIEGLPGQTIGTDFWVGKRLPMFWYGSSGAPLQAGAGPGEATFNAAKARTVLFRNPVKAYHYADSARHSFVQSRLWFRWAYAELESKGIHVRTGSRVS